MVPSRRWRLPTECHRQRTRNYCMEVMFTINDNNNNNHSSEPLLHDNSPYANNVTCSGNACLCLGSNAQSKMGIRHFGNATQKYAVEEATCGTGRLHMHSFSGNSVRYATSCAQPEQFQCATRANCFTQTLGATRARREGGHKLNKAVIERRTGSSRWTFGISQLQAHTAVTNLHDNMHYFFIPQPS